MDGGGIDDTAALTTWMRSVGQRRTWAAGTYLFHRGDPSDFLVLIGSGQVKVVSSGAGGRQVVLALRGPGEVLGEFAALDGGPRSAAVAARSAVEGHVVSSAALLAHLESEPGAALTLLRTLVARLREADLRRLDLGVVDATGRVAGMLVALDRQQGVGGWLALTQAELGETVGASREATVRALTRLRAARLIETARGRVRVTRPDELARLAQQRGQDQGVDPDR